ncbi:hypothetical protein [Halobacteriovorax sp. HLS]|uniref:hypothetical protein n=1 Tax=Halobacteriovorax sp. HLS TaxID=2234000 RepID=UPI000FDAB934|nr:hypothetical protein [Halobacteriovorax sp. HLS]
MKKIILFALLSISSAYAIEIQCFSRAANIHTTIIKEDSTPRLFILFDDGENFLNYFQLDPSLIKVTDTSFFYNDNEMKIELSSTKSGLIESISESILLGNQYQTLEVGNCDFLNIDL